MKYIPKYYQSFMNENLKSAYSAAKKKRIDILKKDPGDYTGENICSFSQSKKMNPELYHWYVEKSKINYSIDKVGEDIDEIMNSTVELMEPEICKPGNILILLKPRNSYEKDLSYIVIDKKGRDHYNLYDNDSKRIIPFHWRKIVLNFKKSLISE